VGIPRLLSQRLEPVPAAGGQQQVVTVAREHPCQFLADAGGGTGNECEGWFQCHGRLPGGQE